jgi:hypothetical protein
MMRGESQVVESPKCLPRARVILLESTGYQMGLLLDTHSEKPKVSILDLWEGAADEPPSMICLMN